MLHRQLNDIDNILQNVYRVEWSKHIHLGTTLRAKWSPLSTRSQPDIFECLDPIYHLNHEFRRLSPETQLSGSESFSHLIQISIKLFWFTKGLVLLSLTFSLLWRLHLSSSPLISKLDFTLCHLSRSSSDILALDASLHCSQNPQN